MKFNEKKRSNVYLQPCRKQVFAERFDDGVFDQKALDGWALEMRNIHGIGDLCPECYKVYRETMDRFYEGGRHGG